VASSPEEQGMSSSKLQEMMDFIESNSLPIHGLVIVRHGYIVWEAYPTPGYDTNTPHRLYSVTKSFTSCLIGIALEKGYIESLNQTMVSFFPNRNITNLNDWKRRITVRDLLMMKSGMKWDESSAPFTSPQNDVYHILHGDGLQYCLNLPSQALPGTLWHYNTGSSHILSGIITDATGMTTLEFARQNLFEPIGIRNVTWSRDEAGTYIGGFDLQITPRDMAKFGYLYLNGGRWGEKQIISSDWVMTSTSALTTLNSDEGYGYQWWTVSSLNLFAARGLYNQMIYVIPNEDLVVAVTAGMNSGDTDPLLSKYILPSITGEGAESNKNINPLEITWLHALSILVALGLVTVTLFLYYKRVIVHEPS
jgi:CubicO group peptidase (beta-lactamase class C family)